MAHRRGTIVLGCFALLSVATLLVAQSEFQTEGPAPTRLRASPQDASRDDQNASELRLREGMRLIDAPGHFESATDVPVFVDEDGRRLTGLENLNLQRIVKTVLAAEDPARLRWKVTGTITEYVGRNYLLIERAVYSPSRQ